MGTTMISSLSICVCFVLSKDFNLFKITILLLPTHIYEIVRPIHPPKGIN